MKTVHFQLEPLSCPSCIQKIKRGLLDVNGVSKAKVLFFSNRARVSFEEAEVSIPDLQTTIEKLGFEVLSHKVS